MLLFGAEPFVSTRKSRKSRTNASNDVLVHEMLHMVEPTHNAHFIALIDRFMPRWRLLRQRLNRLPVRHEDWIY